MPAKRGITTDGVEDRSDRAVGPGQGARPHADPGTARTGDDARADGHSLTLDGAPSNGGQLRVSFAKDDKPVTDLQP